MKSAFSVPPGLEVNVHLETLEESMRQLAPDASRETLIQVVREVVMSEVEKIVQERTEAMWAKGKQAFSAAQQRHREELQQLVEEVSQCHQRQDSLAAENLRLREALRVITKKCSLAFPDEPSPSTFAGSVPDSGYGAFTPSPFTPATDYGYNEVFLPEVPPLPFGKPGVPGSPAPLSLAEALAPPQMPQRTPLSLAESLATASSPSASQTGPCVESTTFSVTINKDAALGLDVSHEEGGKVLQVDGIRQGAVQAWNHQCLAAGDSEKVIKAGDKIASCNGVSDPAKMLEECASQQTLHLTVMREASSPQRLRAEASEFVPSWEAE
ncbi:unnamed protein product [Effrenium voratum]|uniref:PDZ domain-containing protein n=1 Tax=Effrenium voratum TaxID=2562239 RepID=A0AA36IXY4_9DINO|nr:unnamed protein product [Effrenium voratum]